MMRLTLTTLSIAFACALATGAAFARGSGGHPNPGPPGQPAKPAKPTKPANTTKPAVTSLHSKPAKPAKPATAAKPAKPAPAVHHATPVQPLAPVPAPKAHKAPKPHTTSQSRSRSSRSKAAKTAHEKIMICHATGSKTNPYVEITVSINAVKNKFTGAPEGHGRHGGEIVPAPAGGCPTAGQTASTPLSSSGVAPIGTSTPSPSSSGQSKAPGHGVLGARKGIVKPSSNSGVLGAIGRTIIKGTLPFTGLPLWPILLAVVGLLAAGIVLRRRGVQ